MNPDKGIIQASPPSRQSRAFKATIVMTRMDGHEPTMRDVDEALHRGPFAYAMPASIDGPIVISINNVKGDASNA